MQSTLKVKGIGRMQMPPDEIKLTLELVTKEMDYAHAMDEAARRLHALEESLCSVGFLKESIQTTYFSVDTTYVTYEKKREFDGYEVEQRLSIQFDLDTKRLGKIFEAIIQADLDPEINVYFRLKDSHKYKKELLKRATEDAREIAEALAEANGASLGSLLEVRTSAWDHDFISPISFRASGTPAYGRVAEMDIRPADVKETTEAFFVWELLEG